MRGVFEEAVHDAPDRDGLGRPPDPALYGAYRLVAPMKTETATTQQEITAD